MAGNNPDRKFEYKFDDGAVILLEAQTSARFGIDISIGSGRFGIINSEPLKLPIKKKAKQHKALRDAKIPYVLAFFIEDKVYEANDIVEALFGNLKVIINRDTMEIIEQKFDQTGIHFYEDKIFHTSVSGTLIFQEIQTSEGYRLHSWYVENPFSSVPIPSKIFPVRSSFIEISRDKNGVTMKWVEEAS